MGEENCVCPQAPGPTEPPTSQPTSPTTKPIAQVTARPTVLPETGILDMPGLAAFGGGLLLAIVGILLAL